MKVLVWHLLHLWVLQVLYDHANIFVLVVTEIQEVPQDAIVDFNLYNTHVVSYEDHFFIIALKKQFLYYEKAFFLN